MRPRRSRPLPAADRALVTFEPHVRAFWLEPTKRIQRFLRRYHSLEEGEERCPGPGGYHNASTPLPDGRASFTKDGYLRSFRAPARRDPRWPTKCEACDYRFTKDDPWQPFVHLLYADPDGNLTSLADAGPGAMWDAWWLPEAWKGSDGMSLTVKLPNGHEWTVDGVASNCTRKDEQPRAHRCWVRHGDPRTEPVTVDKNGVTCEAGGGSILSDDYHGFLTAGVFNP